MIRIIKGKKYNTETANLCGSWDNGRGYTDFSHVSEELYQKRTGEFFLYGEGGPMSRYSRSTGQNSWSGDERITPLSFEEARAWAEEHLSADEYEATFGEVTEDGETKGVLYSLPVTAIDKVKRTALARKCSASKVIEDLIATL